MIPRYHINLFWSQPDDSWVADVPDLKSCSAFGDTPSEAVTEAQVAIECWIEAATARGLVIPEPRYRPAIYAAA
ncbi:type II toxin-antitoxin system HicB family antitoxin [Sphingomonas bacterium]|uniref:type II toxin-antitoxin system HicB family antitoxin n=1 Tax=Sphingomonas bacterium TaxID=1895847 RepID=UPI001576162D|nr:type II toxin-antitoxin system HicB family antitoxin [Sphingomonas bacterium]